MTDYRFDKFFDFFLKKFGEPHDSKSASEAVIERFAHKLPDQLFSYWRQLGWCGYGNGLIWMTNPAEYEAILENWLQGTPFEDRDDLSVIARTAFGELFVWAKGKGDVLGINPVLNIIYHYTDDEEKNYEGEQENEYMRRFWTKRKKEAADCKDKSDNLIFERTLKKLGVLKPTEVYGFKHHYAIGGDLSLDNVDIMDHAVYHDICCQIAPTQVITIEV